MKQKQSPNQSTKVKPKPPIKQKYIQTPEKMWEYFLLYREGIKTKPILVQDFVGKDGEEVDRKKERPLTMEGFENYLFRENIITDVSDYFENKDKRYESYVHICRAIKRTIKQDQIEGGMAGIYNPSITQRLNGLTENVNTKVEASVSILNIDPIGGPNDAPNETNYSQKHQR